MPRGRTSKKHKCLSESCRVNNQGSVNQSPSLPSTHQRAVEGHPGRMSTAPLPSAVTLPGLPKPQLYLLLGFSNKEYMYVDELAFAFESKPFIKPGEAQGHPVVLSFM